MSGENVSLSYSFSFDELKALAELFRERQNKIPRELFLFSRKIQNKFYESMSIDEVERQYKNEGIA